MSDAVALRRRYERAAERLARARELRAQTQTQLDAARVSLAHHQQAEQAVLAVAALYRKLSLGRIEQLVTSALRAVYEHPYEFEIEVVPKRGQPETRFFVRDGALRLDPVSEKGGGLVDVISLALRVILWSQMRERSAPIMVLDEPARMISRRFIPNFATFISRLSREMGMQFLIVTHRDEVASAADRTFQLRLESGVTQVDVEEIGLQHE